MIKAVYRSMVPRAARLRIYEGRHTLRERARELREYTARFGPVRGLLHLYDAWYPTRLRPGSVLRLQPVSRGFGMERGTPIDRHYIAAFLQRHRDDIRGRVLEAGGYVSYTRTFGGERVCQAEVLYAREGFPDATIVGDLATGRNIPADAFDCIILTQVFCFIYDVAAAVRHTRRALRPGGVLLATVPAISQVPRYDLEQWGDYWRFTEMTARRLFGEVFGPEHVHVEAHGNVCAACAFLQGRAACDLHPEELAPNDPDYPLVITVRAARPAQPGRLAA